VLITRKVGEDEENLISLRGKKGEDARFPQAHGNQNGRKVLARRRQKGRKRVAI
jgi:hypothetical protein